MYLKTQPEKSPDLGDQPGFTTAFACAAQALAIDTAEAVRLNRVYKKKLWGPASGRIQRLLGLQASPDEKTFAMQVAFWQCAQKIKPVDGVLGPESWKKMRMQLPASVSYDRAAALDYARRHWNIVCSDGFIALNGRSGRDFTKVDAGTKFEHEFDAAGSSLHREHSLSPDGTRIEWEDLDDCTHFLSCCIGQAPGVTGGGLALPRQLGSPPRAPYGIVRVSTMVDTLLGRLKGWSTRYAQVIGNEKTSDDSLIGKLEAGDLIAYWNVARKRYSHMAMFLGNNKIACHTYCRSDNPVCTWDNRWDLGRGTHQWTFLHFTV